MASEVAEVIGADRDERPSDWQMSPRSVPRSAWRSA